MMSRISQLGSHFRRLSVLTAAVLFWAAPSATQAAGYVYQQHTLNAGVVFVGSAGTPIATAGDPAPYLFYVLNNRPDARPTDLTLVNPQAPQTVTQAMARRWGYTLGMAVTPSMAGYWEVPLHDLSSEELQQYDVLYLDASGYSFSPADNEKLRRFVDSGGQLFVEYRAASGTPALFTGTDYVTATGTLALPIEGAASLHHPLLSQPYLLSQAEVTSLGTPTGAPAGGVPYANEGLNLFSPVLFNGNTPAIVAGQLGAGQVVASGINIAGAIGGGSGATFTASTAPAADLKFLSNLIAWSETHPNEHKTSHGNASASALSAFSTSWLYTPATPGTNSPPGAAVWGNFVFVTDSKGALDAFNAYPGSNLTGPFGGSEPTTTYPANAYDLIWSSNVGVNASAPTVATHGGVTYVFVEKPDGSVVAFDALTGGTGPTLTNPATTPTSYGAGINAPSPTYYDGRLYAGQADGTLSVYDLNDNTSANFQLDPTASGESVINSPSVGLIPNGDTNVLAAIVPGSHNIYTVLLGARNEPLTVSPPSGGVLNGYSINHSGRYGLNTALIVDTTSAPTPIPVPIPYYSNGQPFIGTGSTANAAAPQDPLFSITEISSFFTDWNMDFARTTQNNTQQVNLNFISANSAGGLNAGGATLSGTISAPAIDRRGDYYYTLTAGNFSYLIGVKNALLPSAVQLKFRFLIPTAGLIDDDNVDYSPLVGFKFAGSPVVDAQGNVYAVATNGTNARVLCFKGNQGASADFKNKNTTFVDLTQVTFQQTDEMAAQPNQLTTGTGPNAQYSASTNQVTFFNFGKTGSPTQQIVGNLTEPQQVEAVPNDNGTGATSPTPLLLHTNLAWYTNSFTFTGNITGLSKVGNSLLLTDGNTLYSLPAAPTVGTGKVATVSPSRTTLSLGTVGAPPSIGGSVLVVNGLKGIGVLTRQVTVVADNHRILGVDSDGAAIWAVDATTNTTATGASKVPFSHPVSLSQFADNEYLVADTGNNRCVRFDSGGNVEWELTRFSDPTGLMAPGQPLTLSQPTSVQPHIVPIPTTAAVNPGGTITYYLVADSGNDRIVEVADTTDASGNLIVVNGVIQSHILTWVTHTGDQFGRRYRYGSATYFPNSAAPSGLSIAATVTNTRIGALTTSGALGPASSDAPGGCLVLFNRPVTPAAFSSNPPPVNDLVYVTPGFFDNTGKPITIRNPRFLQVYTAPSGTNSPVPTVVSPFSFLYADDNGAFDLTYDTTRNSFAVGTKSLQFTATDYQNLMKIPINAAGVAASQNFDRTGFPFVPSSVQRFPADASGYPHYLITQSYSQGEVSGRNGSPVGAATYVQPGLGGEVFEVYFDTTNGNPTSQKFAGSGTYAGHTLSRPTLTGPLTQPTFAIRLP